MSRKGATSERTSTSPRRHPPLRRTDQLAADNVQVEVRKHKRNSWLALVETDMVVSEGQSKNLAKFCAPWRRITEAATRDGKPRRSPSPQGHCRALAQASGPRQRDDPPA